VKSTVWRDGKEMDLDVRTAELPNEHVAQGGSSNGNESPEGRLGLELQTLTPELADRLGAPRDTKGAAIAAVRPGSAAAEAGLRDGDIIVGVDRSLVSDADDAAKRLRESRSGGHLVRVRRGDRSLFVVIASPG